MLNNIRNEDGFTLIEVLVALTIFAVGLLGIAGLQYRAYDFNRNSNVRALTVGVAGMVLEEALALDEENPLFDVTALNMVWDLDPNTAATTLTVNGGGTYSAVWSITTATPIANVARVDVTVNGPEGRNVTLIGYKRFL